MFQTNYNKQKRIWTGNSLPPLYNSKISIGQVILKALTVNGAKTAQISADSGFRMTYTDIQQNTIRAAKNLQSRGYQAKQIFGFIAKNSHHLASIVFSSLCIGCSINTIDSSFGKVELTHMLKATKPNVMFCDTEVYGLVEECLRDLGNNAKIFTFNGQMGDSEQVENLFIETENEDNFTPTCVDGENDIAAIVCSSGTTGFSKGVCLSHAALLDALIGLNIIDSDDLVFSFSSLYWLTGIIALIVGTLNGATRLITTQSFSPKLQLQLIEKYKITYMMNATPQIVLLLKSDYIRECNLSSLRNQYIGGSKLPFGVAVQLNKYMPSTKIQVSYGMSEVAGPISLGFPIINGNDSVGKLMNGATVKIVDKHGNRCEVNVDGEICLKWNYKFLGYCNEEKSTEELVDHEDFVMSGDIGHFDANGYLYIVDRSKDVMKYGNYHVSPSEIEAFLIEFQEIESVCVVGIPDGMGNDLPAAAVIRNASSKIDEKTICDLVSDRFADYYKLRGGVFFVKSFPTTPSGKLLRRKIKEITIASYTQVR